MPDRLDLAVYLVGWSIGWLLLWSGRPLPTAPAGAASGGTRPGVAVVVPARNEAGSLPTTLTPLVGRLGPDDELVVVDDHSTDGTADVARRLGATVVAAPDLPTGWLGKPHACWIGASATSAPILLFVDADVRPAPDLVGRIAVAVADRPGRVVSVQPWHDTGGWTEQVSLLFNVTALMGCAAFTAAGTSVTTDVAFGPVLALERTRYDAVGGHADPTVRTMHTEDIGLARAVGGSALFTGRPDTAFRMYPSGLRASIAGWTRTIATGFRFTRWWVALATLAWVWSLAGGWVATPIVYPLSALQLWVLGRRAGSIHPLTALLFPLAVAAFAVVFVRSLVAVVLRRPVRWKDRTVAAR